MSVCERRMAEKDKTEKDREIDGLKLQVTGLQKEVEGLKGEVEILKNEQQQMRDEMEAKIATLSEKLNELLPPAPPARNVVKKGVENVVTNLVMERRRGEEDYVTFPQPDNHRFKFGIYSATVSAGNIYYGEGIKVWYEVQFVELSTRYFLRMGWASDSLTYVHEHSGEGVGDVSESYAFDPINGSKICEGKQSPWGEQIMEDNGKKYAGVALDLIEGTISFSLDGNWGAPMGIAVHGINKETSFFPAITGRFHTLEINVGDRPFVYGPPDAGYRALVDFIA